MVLIATNTKTEKKSKTSGVKLKVGDFEDDVLGDLTILPDTGAEASIIGPAHLAALDVHINNLHELPSTAHLVAKMANQ